MSTTAPAKNTKSKPETAPRPKAVLASKKTWDGPSLYKECKEQGIYPSFESGNFAGYIDSTTKKKAVTSLPVLTAASYDQYKKAEAAAVEAHKNAKSAKPAKAAKVAKAKGERKPREGGITLENKIHIVNAEPPLRAGAKERFGLIKEGMTVAKYIDLGGKRADIWFDSKQGWIKLS